MVIREPRVRLPRERVAPAAAVPRPRNALLVEAIADRRHGQVRHQVVWVGDARRMRCVDRVDGVDDVPVGAHLAILDHHALVVELRTQIDRGVGPARRACAREPQVIQRRSAERRVKEVVGQHELLRELAERHVRRIVVAHDESADVGPRDEAIHSSAVDLKLLLVEAMHRIAAP